MSADIQELGPQQRAALSQGRSAGPIHALIASLVSESGRVRKVVDVGCGTGGLAALLRGHCDEYVGCDLVRYDGFPSEKNCRFVSADLNHPPYPLDSGMAEAVVAAETIEHLENPRAFVRELVRIATPGGLVVISTPNQLSLLSKLNLVVKNEFNAFQEAPGLYPAHITALVEKDLVRIAAECGLEHVRVHYTNHGRIPLVNREWPSWLGLKGRAFSDNVVLAGRRRRT